MVEKKNHEYRKFNIKLKLGAVDGKEESFLREKPLSETFFFPPQKENYLDVVCKVRFRKIKDFDGVIVCNKN